MIVVRSVISGVRDHFIIRISEWVMLVPTSGMWFGLEYVQPNMFATSNSFKQLDQMFTEQTWAMLVLLCAVARFCALIVNGTFDVFKYSPHIRAAASILGLIFWSQFCVGIFQAYLYDGGSFSGVVAYSTFVILELANFYRSTKDIGSTYADAKRRKNAGFGI